MTASHIPYFDIHDMITVTTRLVDLMQQEVSLLKEMKVMELKTLREEKFKLVSLLENYWADLKQNPALLEELPAESLAKLRLQAEQLQSVMTEDNRMLTKARRAHGLIMDTIRSIVVERTATLQPYAANGSLHTHKNSSGSIPPMRLDEQF